MENWPLISVIVPAYKVEAYLDRCISSIAQQTYTNLDIILDILSRMLSNDFFYPDGIIDSMVIEFRP